MVEEEVRKVRPGSHTWARWCEVRRADRATKLDEAS